MRNELSVTIRKASRAIGAGLLEEALEREGSKGCSSVLCTSPVALEPPYQRFDSSHVLGLDPGAKGRAAESTIGSVDWVTVEVYPAEEDLLSITWMETVLRSLAVLSGPMAFELYGTAGRVWVRFAVRDEEVSGLRAALLGHFPALYLRIVDCPFPREAPGAVNELVPVGPYHRSLTLLGKEGASPLGLATVVLLELGECEHGVFQVLLSPASPGHDWHFNVESMVEAELRAVQFCQLGGLSTNFSYDAVLPPLLEPSVREKVRVDVGFFACVARYVVWSCDAERIGSFLQGMRVATGMLRFGNRAWRVLSHSDLVRYLGLE